MIRAARPALAALALLGLAACSQGNRYVEAEALQHMAKASNRTLAYEHAVTLDTSEGEIRNAYEATVSACTSAPNASCTVLNASLQSGRNVSALVKMRATPETVRSIMAGLGRTGEVTHVETTAEDLAVPIADAERDQAKLTAYQGKLEALMARAPNDVDALIKIQRELAEVQAKLDALAGERAQLERRVRLEVLTVQIESDRQRGFWQPVGTALEDFGSDLSRGIASVVSGLAYIVPWSLVLFAALRGVRWWRLRMARMAASAT